MVCGGPLAFIPVPRSFASLPPAVAGLGFSADSPSSVLLKLIISSSVTVCCSSASFFSALRLPYSSLTSSISLLSLASLLSRLSPSSSSLKSPYSSASPSRLCCRRVETLYDFRFPEIRSEKSTARASICEGEKTPRAASGRTWERDMPADSSSSSSKSLYEEDVDCECALPVCPFVSHRSNNTQRVALQEQWSYRPSTQEFRKCQEQNPFQTLARLPSHVA